VCVHVCLRAWVGARVCLGVWVCVRVGLCAWHVCARVRVSGCVWEEGGETVHLCGFWMCPPTHINHYDSHCRLQFTSLVRQ